jgi:moderate conductance mechanosensitive channel
MFQQYIEKLLPQLLDMGVGFLQVSLRIVIIIIAAFVSIRVLKIAMNRLESLVVRATAHTDIVPGAASKRIRTLMNVLWTIVVGLIWFVATLTTLGQIGVNVGPILAGAGVVGLAVGFGAQNLVKDLVSGFFLILENQVRVGDVAEINGTGGLVEAITFRTIVLRDLSAVVHVFPNGSINTLSNRTKDWSAYVIDMGVAYKEDTDHVVEVMRQVGEELRADAQYGPSMLEAVEILGVDEFADSAVNIKVRLKTLPLQQWNVGREYRRRLKKAFDAARIEIPFPHRTLYMGEASPAFKFAVQENRNDSVAQN